MRRKEQEITDFDRIEEIIKESKVCRLGLCEEERPYVVPLNFGYRDRKLFFHCAKEGRKVDILRANPHVCFEFDFDLGVIKDEKACNWGSKYKSVIGFGKAAFLEDADLKAGALDVIMQNYSDEKHEYSRSSIDNTLVFVVEIEEVTGKQAI